MTPEQTQEQTQDQTLALTITDIQDATPRVRVFRLEGSAPLPPYTPGAHLDFQTEAGPKSYSLIDWEPAPAAPEYYRIAVQREDDGAGGSQAMHNLQTGDRLQAAPPKNDFPLADHDGPALLLAGGIGITPLISHACALKAASRPYSFHYSARSRDVMAFGDRLADLHQDRLTRWYDATAPLDLAALLGAVDPATYLYICGPKGMIEAAKAAAPLPEDQIHFELFTNAATESGDGAFEVEIADGRVFTIPPGQTIIEALEAEGVDLIYDCQRGDCGICQTDVIQGEPDHRDVVLSQSERDGGKVMQICVSRAKSARLVLDI